MGWVFSQTGLWIALTVRLGVGGLVDIVLMGGDGTKVAKRVGIFSSSARGLVGEFLYQILFADFSFPLNITLVIIA